MSRVARTAAVAASIALGLFGRAHAADAPSDMPKAARTAEQIAALRKLVMEGLAAPLAKDRVAAGVALVAAWPDSAPILDEALTARSAAVRLEAVNLLDGTGLGDPRPRLLLRFDDGDADVRRQAIRVAGHLDWPEVEPALMRIASTDALWPVRQEALRSLERCGSARCLNTVLQGFIADKDAEHRRRYKRVLVAILKLDRGEDIEAWRTAIAEAVRMQAELDALKAAGKPAPK